MKNLIGKILNDKYGNSFLVAEITIDLDGEESGFLLKGDRGSKQIGFLDLCGYTEK